MSQLSYAELNTELVQCFGELEQLCNQILTTSHGVTAYINEMESIALCNKTSRSQWDYMLNKLKSVRHKRNKLSHGEVSFYEPYAEVADIHFIKDFRMQIIERTDPLAALHLQKVTETNPTTAQQNTNPQGSSDTNIVTAMLSSLIVFIGIFLIFYLLSYFNRYR